jgi:peptide methionine sulfoxide reductase msrA/msrB
MDMRMFFMALAALTIFLLVALAAHAGPDRGDANMNANTEELQKATFAGGCFWCVEAAFDDVPGVVSAISGYAGGKETNPTYE